LKQSLLIENLSDEAAFYGLK